MTEAYHAALAGLLFPEGDAAALSAEHAEHYEAKYPPRALPGGAAVTRLGPSPTGYVHLGNLFMAIVNQRLARQSGGVFLLRIEDTDQKREVAGAVPGLIGALAYFGIEFDEGALAKGGEVSDSGIESGEGVFVDGDALSERGEYGPYFQSSRRDIYKAFARKLVLEGKAYPCFLTEEQIATTREKQEKNKALPGIYGEYAVWRGADLEAVTEKVRAGEPYVIRLNAEYGTRGSGGQTITVADGIRGEITMPENIMDVVILKRDGLPTYHFAHVVDDHLMRATHVVRGEEWLSSLPVHIALFSALGFEPPVYCHTALLMKTDGGGRRKLSKRLDPEAALSYYISEGYHPDAIQEYLLTLINSNYEEWRLSSPDVDNSLFAVTTEKMGFAGMLLDLDKLQNVSRETLARIPAGELADFMIDWAGREKPDALQALLENRDVLAAALDIGRSGEKPRKDLVCGLQIFGHISYFFDAFFRMEDPLPDNIPEDEAKALLEAYLESYDHGDGRDAWFEKIRELAAERGYAPKPKDYKNNPGMYKGHVGDVSAVIRRALTGRLNAPDIYEIQQILGEERTRARLSA